MKKNWILKTIICCVLGLLMVCIWKVWDSPVPVRCYVLDWCGGCSVVDKPCNVCRDEQQYRTKLGDLIWENGLSQQVDFELYNILYSFYKKQLLESMGVQEEPEDMIYPVAFVGDTMLLGTEEIDSRLIETIEKESTFWKKLLRITKKQGHIQPGEKNISEMVFFTMEGCSDCEEAKSWLDKKNEELNGEIYKNMQFYPVGGEIPGSWEMLKKVYILYGREQESLWVPTIIAGDQCLIGMSEIQTYFEQFEPDKKIKTKVPEDYE